MKPLPLALALAALAAPACAHVSLETSTAAPGATYKAVLQIPHGCDGQATNAVRVALPAGFIDAKPMPKPGWNLAIERAPYDKAYDLHGARVTEGPVAVTWSGGALEDAWYDEFVVRGTVAAPAGATLAFSTTQTCATASVAWDGIPAPGQTAHDLDHPAPTLTVADAAPAADEHAHHGAAAADEHAQHGAAAAPAATLGTATVGDLAIAAAWVRGTPPGAPVAAGYLTITNNGSVADRLVGGSAPFATSVEVHEMITEGGMMQMRPVAGGLAIAPGATVTLSPGGLHLMLAGLTAAAKPGATVPVTLTFEKAGTVTVAMPVSAIGAQRMEGR